MSRHTHIRRVAEHATLPAPVRCRDVRRSSFTVVVAAIVALAAPGTAFADPAPRPLTWAARSVALPAAGDGAVLTTFAGVDGSVFTLRGQPGTSSARPADVTLQRVEGAAAATVAVLPKARVLAVRPRPAGGADLLVVTGLTGTGGATATGTLKLLRAGAVAGAATPQTLWRSVAGQRPLADFGRVDAGRLALAWQTARGTFGLVTSGDDGAHMGAARTVHAGGRELRSMPATSVAVGVRTGGAPMIAWTEHGRAGRGSTQVVQTTPAGTVTGRQAFPRAEGLVRIEQSTGGRLGLLVHDTGRAGDRFGTCKADGAPRRLWATSSEPHGSRFQTISLLAQQRAACPSGGEPALLVGRAGQLIAVWGAIADGRKAPRVDAAWSSPLRGGFGRSRRTLWPGAFLSAAAVNPRTGTLFAALATPTAGFASTGNGITIAQRAFDGQSRRDPVRSDRRAGTLAIDRTGRALMTWTEPAAPSVAAGPVLAIGTP
jgi:hypothetical protein